jgi:osmotically-inducible protein OsmY
MIIQTSSQETQGATLMKTDSDLQRDLLAELSWEPSVQAQHIGVSVKNGIVTLTGDVPTYAEKFATEKATRRVSGVQAIAEELKVNLLEAYQRNDSDIAQSAINTLDWNVSVPKGKVKVMVENGWLTLSGDVDWNFQREAAHDAVRHLMGVKAVTDQIKLNVPNVSTAEVRTKIDSAIKRNMVKDIAGITIEADNGKVKLHGKVHSWEEHDAAGSAAWSTLGVSSVENDLVVAY